MMTRRKAIQTGVLAGAAIATVPAAIAQTNVAPAAATNSGPYALPALPYAYDVLEPYIDARTMEIHHDKHHAAYVANLNKAVADYPDVARQPVEDLLKDLNAVPEKIRTAVRNQGGGHYNHSLFWQMLKKDGGEPSGELAKAIESAFGSFSSFKEDFTKAAVSQFGSGWAWLVSDKGGKLQIMSSPNQDNPMSQGFYPIMGNDVWEHAYYLKYQNRRGDYLKEWWNVVNWNEINRRFQESQR